MTMLMLSTDGSTLYLLYVCYIVVTLLELGSYSDLMSLYFSLKALWLSVWCVLHL